MKVNYDSWNELLSDIMSEGNVAQGKAIKSIVNTDKHLFITGRGGVGKSVFIQRISSLLDDCAIVAPTGVAALNVKGSTIHSFFGLDLDPYIPKINKGKFWNSGKGFRSGDLSDRIKKLKTLIIDEISMVRADLLDKVADVLRSVNRNNKPFGGVRLIMFGDLSQLPPIVDNNVSSFFYSFYRTRYFFSSKALMASGFEVHYFTKVYRQKDEDFINILDHIRFNKMTEEDKKKLESRVRRPEDGVKYINLVPTNNKANDINMVNLMNINSEEKVFRAIVRGIPPKQAPCEDELHVKKGCQIMITKNIGTAVNGSIGTIVGFTEEIAAKMNMDFHNMSMKGISVTDEMKEGYVRMKQADGIIVELNGKEGKPIIVQRETWENISYSVNNRVLQSVSRGAITQYPIKLGYAISIHKSQGMSLDAAYIDVSGSFESGQSYVAMSRIRSLDGLYMMKEINDHDIIADEEVIDFYDRINNGETDIKPVPIKQAMADVKEESKKNAKRQEVIDFGEWGL